MLYQKNFSWSFMLSLLVVLSCALFACDGSNTNDPETDPDAAIIEPDAATPLDDASAGDAGPELILGVPGAESTDEQCLNGIDDDESGYLDCDDFWCSGTATVQVCSSLENTDELCSDGVDNAEKPTGKRYSDGLADCLDPDCYKNPRVTVCAHTKALRWESIESCAAETDSDEDGLNGCLDPDCWVAGTNCALNGKTRVLFDNAHRQRAGNGDWVVDISGRLPWPSIPESETDWSGALSSMGKSLFDSGYYTIETLPPHEALSFGTGHSQDLMNYGVLVIPEPSVHFSADEARAVLAFVESGGGILIIADHAESDRDGNGWDSVQSLNDLFKRAGQAEGGIEGTLEQNPFGFSVSEVGYNASKDIDRANGSRATTLDEGAATHPVLSGRHGTVRAAGMYVGGLFTIHDTGKARALIHALPLGSAGYESGSPYVVVSEVGQGRVVAIGDSAMLNDGTDSHGRRDANADAWNATDAQNAALVLNAIDWLAKKEGIGESDNATQ